MKKLKNKLIVLVDLDNVLNNFTEVILTHYNADHNTSHKLEDVKVYSMEDSLGIPFNTLYQYFISPDIMNSCKPLKDAQKYLKIINELSKTYIVTARYNKQLYDIDDWFAKYYPFIKSEQIICCKDKHMIHGDIRIDDHYENLKYSSDGKILFNYPFNQNIDLTDTLVYRVNNWEECFSACMLMMGYNSDIIKHYIEVEGEINNE